MKTLGVLAAIMAVLCANVAPAFARLPHRNDPSCQLSAYGDESFVGFAGLQERWTEYFSNNNCGRPVRARVYCNDEFSTGSEVHYGGTLYGNGYSYYTCDVTQNLAGGNAQAYVNGQWINYDS